MCLHVLLDTLAGFLGNELLLGTTDAKYRANIKTLILSSNMNSFLSRGRTEGQYLILLASQLISQPAVEKYKTLVHSPPF